MPYFIRTHAGLVPDDQEAVDLLAKIKIGEGVQAEIKRNRLYWYHKKFFKMLAFAFDHWEPPSVEYGGKVVGKSLEVFRAWCIMQAGYVELAVTPDGKIRVEPMSIKFSKMGQDEFEKLHNDVCNVVLRDVLANYKRADLDEVVERLCRF